VLDLLLAKPSSQIISSLNNNTCRIMSLKFGLNIKSKAPVPSRRAILDDDEFGDEDDAAASSGPTETAIEEISFVSKGLPVTKAPSISIAKSKPKSQPPKASLEPRENRSAISAANRSLKAAEEEDPSLFDYDSFLEAKAVVSESKKAAARQEAIERKPKYINNLLDAASRRKQDQLVAREKLLQREREAEGDEFADKEKFVTTAYKQQQEETQRLQEEEKRKAELDAKRKGQLGGGMQSFYRNMMDQNERQHQEAMEAAAKADPAAISGAAQQSKEKTDAELAAEARGKGISVHTNEEGQIIDKRELLSAGLNIGTSGSGSNKHGADHLLSSNRPAQSAFANRNPAHQQGQRERQSRMMEEQLAAQAKRARDEEAEERERLEKAARSSKTDKDIGDAKARYLARKAAKERGEG
jgi:hypothetical protein